MQLSYCIGIMPQVTTELFNENQIDVVSYGKPSCQSFSVQPLSPLPLFAGYAHVLLLAPNSHLCFLLSRYFENLGCGWFSYSFSHSSFLAPFMHNGTSAPKSISRGPRRLLGTEYWRGTGRLDPDQVLVLPFHSPESQADLMYSKFFATVMTLRLGQGYNVAAADGDS